MEKAQGGDGERAAETLSELFWHWGFVSNKWPSWKIPRERPNAVPAGEAELKVCERDTTGKFAAADASLNCKTDADWEFECLELFYL